MSRSRTVDDLDGLAGVATPVRDDLGPGAGPADESGAAARDEQGRQLRRGGVPRRELVGACVGFHEEPPLQTLHSHIAGVIRGPWRNVGFALKLHQRAWALRRGIAEIAWTYDPLVPATRTSTSPSSAPAPTRVPAPTSTATWPTRSTATTRPTGC